MDLDRLSYAYVVSNMKPNEARMLLAAGGCVLYVQPKISWYIHRYELIFKIIKLTKHGHQILAKNLINGHEEWLLTKDVIKASDEEIAEAISIRLTSNRLCG